jgi:hypothetical protein
LRSEDPSLAISGGAKKKEGKEKNKKDLMIAQRGDETREGGREGPTRLPFAVCRFAHPVGTNEGRPR